MVVPAPVPGAVAGPGGSGYQYVSGIQAGPVSFGPGHVAGPYQQNPAVPVSYNYPQVGPMVIAQPQQRVPSTPYYYNSTGFSVSQAGSGHIPPQHHQHMYQAHQQVAGHMQTAGMQMGARGGQGNARRGTTSRSRGKHYSHHAHGQAGTPNNVEKVAVKSPEQGAGDGGQR